MFVVHFKIVDLQSLIRPWKYKIIQFFSSYSGWPHNRTLFHSFYNLQLMNVLHLAHKIPNSLSVPGDHNI